MGKSYRRLLLCLMIACLVAAPAYAAPATLVGSWTSVAAADAGVENRTLWTFNRGGTLVVSGDAGNFSAGHGAWKRVAPRTFEATNVAFGFAPDGSLAFTLQNRATFEVSRDGDHFTAVFVSEIVALDGTVIDSLTGTATGDRIKAN